MAFVIGALGEELLLLSPYAVWFGCAPPANAAVIVDTIGGPTANGSYPNSRTILAVKPSLGSSLRQRQLPDNIGTEVRTANDNHVVDIRPVS